MEPTSKAASVPLPTCPHGYDGAHTVYFDVLVSGCHGFETMYLGECEGPDPEPAASGEVRDA